MTSVRLNPKRAERAEGIEPPFHSSSLLTAFSTMMMEASTMAPMAMAMPPRLMMLEETPRYFMAMKDMRMARGRVRIITNAEGRFQRKTRHTTETATANLINSWVRVWM